MTLTLPARKCEIPYRNFEYFKTKIMEPVEFSTVSIFVMFPKSLPL